MCLLVCAKADPPRNRNLEWQLPRESFHRWEFHAGTKLFANSLIMSHLHYSKIQSILQYIIDIIHVLLNYLIPWSRGLWSASIFRHKTRLCQGMCCLQVVGKQRIYLGSLREVQHSLQIWVCFGWNWFMYLSSQRSFTSLICFTACLVLFPHAWKPMSTASCCYISVDETRLFFHLALQWKGHLCSTKHHNPTTSRFP